MIEYFYLFIAHLIGDSLFSSQLREAKRRSLFHLGIHSAIYAVIVLIAFYFIAHPRFMIYSFILLFTSHFIIDYWKCYIVQVDGVLSVKFLFYNIIDQILHLLIIVLLVNIM